MTVFSTASPPGVRCESDWKTDSIFSPSPPGFFCAVWTSSAKLQAGQNGMIIGDVMFRFGNSGPFVWDLVVWSVLYLSPGT